jgi:S-formylglutathione hydrolase
MTAFETLSEQVCFGGVQGFYRHESKAVGGAMRFAVYKPPQADKGKVPVVTYLAGLTCTEETFTIKAGAQRVAAELGLMLVMPDTSPRATRHPGDDASWDFGQGAGFYVDATAEPWRANYRMYSYVTEELPALIGAGFPARMERQGIFGHSMGGHGALVLGLRNPGTYRTISAFAPIVAPMQVPWGKKAFSGYLGSDEASWAAYDASALVRAKPTAGTILIDQGVADKFLAEQLRPELFEEACKAAGQKLTLRRQPGYDHSYYFIQTFIADHLKHHATGLA